MKVFPSHPVYVINVVSVVDDSQSSDVVNIVSNSVDLDNSCDGCDNSSATSSDNSFATSSSDNSSFVVDHSSSTSNFSATPSSRVMDTFARFTSDTSQRSASIVHVTDPVSLTVWTSAASSPGSNTSDVHLDSVGSETTSSDNSADSNSSSACNFSATPFSRVMDTFA